MLTFFRRIRKGLLVDGATSKYLLYAIGEILLVMIGILLALQVNNWNQERTNNIKEYDLIRILSKELINTREYLDSRIEDLNERIRDNGPKILEYTKSQRKDIGIDSFSFHLMRLWSIGGFAPQTAKFQQVISGNDMDLIRFDSLQLLLTQYEYQLMLAKNHDIQARNRDEMTSFWNKHLVIHTIVKQGDFGWYDLFEFDEKSSFNMDINSILSNPEFENIVVNRLMLFYSTRKRLESVQRHTDKLLNFIDRNYQFY